MLPHGRETVRGLGESGASHAGGALALKETFAECKRPHRDQVGGCSPGQDELRERSWRIGAGERCCQACDLMEAWTCAEGQPPGFKSTHPLTALSCPYPASPGTEASGRACLCLCLTSPPLGLSFTHQKLAQGPLPQPPRLCLLALPTSQLHLHPSPRHRCCFLGPGQASSILCGRALCYPHLPII